MSLSDIAARAIGQYPLSIPTSLALEAACGIHPDYPVKMAPILNYDELWINLRTLFRNFMGSLEKGIADTVSPRDCVTAINEELVTIYNIIKEKTNSRTNVIFYVSNYDGIESHYPYAVIRRDNTAKQKIFTAIMTEVIDGIIKSHPEGNIHVVRLKLHPEKKSKAMIITHIVYDLVAAKHFQKLTLLESHTGAIKEKSQLGSKYYDGKHCSMLPFREDLLQIFGDHETFRPLDIKIRKELMEIATKYRWTALTTDDMVRYGVNQMKNPLAREIVRKILV
jgi:hypothetical protein